MLTYNNFSIIMYPLVSYLMTLYLAEIFILARHHILQGEKII